MSNDKKKALLNEATTKRFWKLAGLRPIHEKAYMFEEDEELEEGMYAKKEDDEKKVDEMDRPSSKEDDEKKVDEMDRPSSKEDREEKMAMPSQQMQAQQQMQSQQMAAQTAMQKLQMESQAQMQINQAELQSLSLIHI